MMKILTKLIAIISALYGIIIMYFGPMSFTYFTNLSNIFVIIVLTIFLIKDIKEYKGNKVNYSNKLYITKFLMTISISLTFLVFMFLLAPTMEGGIINAYLDGKLGSFCLHFLTPLLAIIDFLIYDIEYKPKKIHSVYAIIPPLLYTLFIVVISSLGIRWGNMSAPYNFMNFGAKTGWFGFDLSIMGWESLGIGVFYMILLLSLLFILLGLLFIKIKREK